MNKNFLENYNMKILPFLSTEFKTNAKYKAIFPDLVNPKFIVFTNPEHFTSVSVYEHQDVLDEKGKKISCNKVLVEYAGTIVKTVIDEEGVKTTEVILGVSEPFSGHLFLR